MKTFRQGDLLVIPTNNIPKTAKKVVGNIILRGEVTNHSHRLVGSGDVFSDNGSMYFTVKTKATLVHEEHKPIEFGKGKWAVTRQREYVSADMTRVVVD